MNVWKEIKEDEREFIEDLKRTVVKIWFVQTWRSQNLDLEEKERVQRPPVAELVLRLKLCEVLDGLIRVTLCGVKEAYA